jgi:hypothetical protein
MTPVDALCELLERVGACRGTPVLVNEEELRQWPTAAVKAMKSQKLIAKASPATSAICPGCELECVMPVDTLSASGGARSSFIVCDKRSDINRVPVPSERLVQWQCSADLVSEFVAASLGLRPSTRPSRSAGRWEIGIASGRKRSQMLCLEADGTLFLVAGGNKVVSAEFIRFHGGEYAFDDKKVRRLVDAATTADERYTPSNDKREKRRLETQAMYRRWHEAYLDWQERRPGMPDSWYAKQIAKTDIGQRRDSETIRKNMKK